MVRRGALHHVQLHRSAAPGVRADLIISIIIMTHHSYSDLCVSRAPAAPDQRAEVLEAEHRPPEEGEVTHADQGHAHQVYQVKLETEKPCIAASWFHLD